MIPFCFLFLYPSNVSPETSDVIMQMVSNCSPLLNSVRPPQGVIQPQNALPALSPHIGPGLGPGLAPGINSPVNDLTSLQHITLCWSQRTRHLLHIVVDVCLGALSCSVFQTWQTFLSKWYTGKTSRSPFLNGAVTHCKILQVSLRFIIYHILFKFLVWLPRNRHQFEML